MCTEHQWCTELIRCAQNSSAVHGTQARGAQNSSAVHGTHVREASSVHRTHPLCTELPVTRPLCTELVNGAQKSSSVHRTRPLSTELVRGAQNSSAVHGTRQCCTEPTTAVHRTRWNPRSRCTSPRAARSAQCVAVAHRVRDARDRPGPPGPSPTAPAPPCTHHEPLGIQPMTYQFLTCTG